MKTHLFTVILILMLTPVLVFAARPSINALNTRVNQLEAELSALKSVKRVFVTSEVFTGKLGTISGADLKCQNAADNAGLGGQWKAWLTGGNRRDVTIAGRLSRHLGLYIAVRNNPSNLFDLIADPLYGDFPNKLFAPINTDEFGNSAFSVNDVWTNTSTTPTVGGFGEASCRSSITNIAWDHGLADKTGHVGTNDLVNGKVKWQDAGTDTCDQLKHLYCFEQ